MPNLRRISVPDEIQRAWRRTLVLCLMILAALIASAALTARSLWLLSEEHEVVTRALRLDNALINLKSQMLDAETGQRGFLLSGRATYLQPYYVALSQLQASRTALAASLSHEAGTARLFANLEQAITAKLQELERTIKLKNDGHNEEASAALLTDSGKQTMDAMRDALRVLMSSESHRSALWSTEHAQEIRANYGLLAASLTCNLLLFAALLQRMRHAAREVSKAHREQSRWLEAAAARNKQVLGLSELSRFLQSCVDMDEAVRLLKQQLPLLMRASSGALYLLANARDQLHQAFAWGEEPYTDYFEPGDCWAVRLGQPFHQPLQAGAAACTHLQSAQAHARTDTHCLPLVAHGELMGLLVLDAGIASEEKVNVENEGYRRITLEQVGLSIGNLLLRESLRQQSIRDPLTGLYNRRFLEESAQREVLRASRQQEQGGGHGMALLMIDIDHFKRFNDEHGHEVGDQVLREVAQVLQRQTRGSDMAARYGGEEFTIVLADMPEALATERAEQVRADVEALAPQIHGKTLGAITISIGLAQFPGHGSTVEALFLAADKALYEAKHSGRNRVVVAT